MWGFSYPCPNHFPGLQKQKNMIEIRIFRKSPGRGIVVGNRHHLMHCLFDVLHFEEHRKKKSTAMFFSLKKGFNMVFITYHKVKLDLLKWTHGNV